MSKVQLFTVKIESKKDFQWAAGDILDMLNSAMGAQSRCTMVSEIFGDHKPVSQPVIEHEQGGGVA